MGSRANPVYLQGDSNIGKTSLMCAVGPVAALLARLGWAWGPSSHNTCAGLHPNPDHARSPPLPAAQSRAGTSHSLTAPGTQRLSKFLQGASQSVGPGQ